MTGARAGENGVNNVVVICRRRKNRRKLVNGRKRAGFIDGTQ